MAGPARGGADVLFSMRAWTPLARSQIGVHHRVTLARQPPSRTTRILILLSAMQAPCWCTSAPDVSIIRTAASPGFSFPYLTSAGDKADRLEVRIWQPAVPDAQRVVAAAADAQQAVAAVPVAQQVASPVPDALQAVAAVPDAQQAEAAWRPASSRNSELLAPRVQSQEFGTISRWASKSPEASVQQVEAADR
jgi:hypothetical protein